LTWLCGMLSMVLSAGHWRKGLGLLEILGEFCNAVLD
jgi:hypothetical protein